MTDNSRLKTQYSKLGIAGFGFVGQAVYAGIKNTSDVSIYDRYKEPYTKFGEIVKSDFLFVCLPTPMDNETGMQNIEELKLFLNLLSRSSFIGIVIVKSTVLYPNIKKWIGELDIVLNPEFLNQNSANDDFENQTMVVLGGSAENCCKVRDLYQSEFNLKDPSFQLMSSEEACWFKYMHNIYHAYQVLFWNYAHKLTGNSRKYVQLYEKLYGRKPILSQVCTDGELGYGGACFPKDVNAMQFNNPHLLTEFMCRFNATLRPQVEPSNAVIPNESEGSHNSSTQG